MTVTAEMQFYVIQLQWNQFHYETKTSFDNWITLHESILCRCPKRPHFQDDRSGVLEEKELEKLWSELMTWKGVFLQFDKDNSGFMDVSELKHVFRSVGQ